VTKQTGRSSRSFPRCVATTAEVGEVAQVVAVAAIANAAFHATCGRIRELSIRVKYLLS